MLINLICVLLIHPLGHTDCRGRVNIAPDLTFSPLPNLPSGTPSNCPAPRTQGKRGRVETQTKQGVFPPVSSQGRAADRLHSGVFLKEGKRRIDASVLLGFFGVWASLLAKVTAPHGLMCQNGSFFLLRKRGLLLC